jgi:hypothetical protein
MDGFDLGKAQAFDILTGYDQRESTSLCFFHKLREIKGFVHDDEIRIFSDRAGPFFREDPERINIASKAFSPHIVVFAERPDFFPKTGPGSDVFPGRDEPGPERGERFSDLKLSPAAPAFIF